MRISRARRRSTRQRGLVGLSVGLAAMSVTAMAAGAAAMTLSAPSPSAAVALTSEESATALGTTQPSAKPTASQLASTKSSWYVTPSPMPHVPPGAILKWRKWTFNLEPTSTVSSPATAWQIMYRSTNAARQAIAVTGTILVPTAAWTGAGPRPIVAYASGTQGWGNQCAPSREMKAGDYDEGFAVQNLLDQGWAVAVTDYPGLGTGLGTPGHELYAVNSAEGYAVLDALRAAENLRAAKLSHSAPVAIEGYSQGGGAAAFAAQEQAKYAPGLHLKGVALGGTPANLQAVAKNLNGGPFFGFLAGAAIGFNFAYTKIDLNSYLNSAGRKAFHQLDAMCQEQGLVTFAGKKIQDYTKGGINPINVRKIARVLNANDAGKVAPRVPVLQYHGLADEVIPYAVEQALHTQWCKLGARSDLVPLPGDHVETQVEAQPLVVEWITSVFNGQKPADNCSSPSLP